MLCHNCGQENIAGMDVCEHCGTDLAGHDIPEAADGFKGKLLQDRIESLKWNPTLEVRGDAGVAEAIAVMRAGRQGCVLVREGRRVSGIFTERDVLVRVLRRGLDPSAVKLSSVMTPDPITLSPSDPLAHAVHLMAVHGIRHVPIQTGDDPLGLVSARCVLRYLHEEVIGS